jgi:predicted O-methyltransferase YrrM
MSENNCQKQIEEIFRNGKVTDCGGRFHDLSSNIDRNEGTFIYNIIKQNKCGKTLEVGCAMGISSLYICAALEGKEGAIHTIIDPMQTTDWHSIGITQLNKAEVDFYRLLEEPSEFILPQLVKSGEKYDFCFIDGWHTFDHTLIDFFYIDRLLDEGGIVAIDDITFPGIKKLMRYIVNYPNYMVIGNVSSENHRGFIGYIYDGIVFSFRPLSKLFPKKMRYRIFSDNIIRPDKKLGLNTSMIALQKTGPDTRRWDWYVDF